MHIIIAPRHSHKYLLSTLRGSDPFCDAILISKNELAKYVYPLVKEEAFIYLMKEKEYSYEVANMLLEFVPYIESNESNKNDSKIKKIIALKDELIKHGLLADLLTSSIYKDATADVYGYYKEDAELNHILSALNIKATYHTNNKDVNPNNFYEFSKMEDEVYFVLNRIASLLDSGVSIKDIIICSRNESYDYYLAKFSPMFGYKLNLKNKDSYMSLGAIKEFFNLYDASKDINGSLTQLKEIMKDDPLYEEVNELISNNIVKGFDFEHQRDYLFNRIKERRLSSIRYDNAVEVTDLPIGSSKKYIFVIGFTQGQFPKRYKDDKYLNNEELTSINRLTDKQKTKVDELACLDLLFSENEVICSYSKKSFKESFFPSPLIARNKINAKHVDLDDVYYSSEVLKLQFANLSDLNYFYKEQGDNYKKLENVVKIEYNDYDPSFSGTVEVFGRDEKYDLSTTQLDNFNNCPYKYYVERILKLDESEETDFIVIGKVAHKMFEICREPNFDFDVAYEAEISKYSVKSPEKIIFFTNLKKQIKAAVDAIKEREKRIKNHKVYEEEKLEYPITKNVIIKGTIDCLITIDDKYFVCIDYKTGKKKFDDKELALGLSTQLPTYMLLIKKDKRFENLEPLGVYINNVILDEYKTKQGEDDLIPEHLKLNGKTLNDLSAATLLDPTIADGDSQFIKGLGYNAKKDTLTARSGLTSKNEFEGYIDIAEKLYNNAISEMAKGNYQISPIFISENNNACTYCDMKEICHKRDSFYREIVEEEGEEDGKQNLQ